MRIQSTKQQGARTLSTVKTKKTIIERICTGESLRKICKAPGMPDRATVHRWLLSDTDFCDQYARAREIQAEEIFDEILEISDDSRRDYITGDDGQKRINREAIDRAKLKIDARKWILAKMVPKKYSEKMELEHSGSVDLPGFTFREKKPDQEG